MNRAGACLAILAGLALAAAPASAQTIERVVAVVDGDAILLSELREASLRSPCPSLGDVLDALIEARLIAHEAARDGIVVTDAEVDAAVANVAPLAGTGTPTADRIEMRNMMLRFRVLTARMSHWVNVDEDQLRARYDELSMRARRNAAVDITQLRVPLARTASSEELLATRDRAEALRASAVAARDRDAALADAGAVASTTFWPTELGAEVADALAELDVGDVSPVLFDGRGFVVVLLRARRASSPPAYDEVRTVLRAQLVQEALEALEPTLMENLRRGATIQRMLDE